MFWHAPETVLGNLNVVISGTDKGREMTDTGLKCTNVWIPVDGDLKVVVEIKYDV